MAVSGINSKINSFPISSAYSFVSAMGISSVFSLLSALSMTTTIRSFSSALGIGGLNPNKAGMGHKEHFVNRIGFGYKAHSCVKMDLSPGAQKVFNLRNKLGNDEVKSIQNMINSLLESFFGLHVVKNDLAQGIGSILNLRNKLGNDEVKSILAIINSMIESASNFQTIKNDLSPGAQEVFNLRNKLGNDEVKSISAIIVSMIEQAQSFQTVKNDLSPGAQKVFSILNNLGNDPVKSIQNLINNLVESSSGSQSNSNALSAELKSLQKIINTISDTDAQSTQNIRNVIDNFPWAQSIQNMITAIGSQGALYPSITYEIYLDGGKIKNYITDLSVTYDQDSAHNQISFSSIDNELYRKCDPEISKGESRIELHLGSRVIYFLLENRMPSETSFSVWGRSISAKDDSPYQDSIIISLTSPTMASDIAGDVLNYSALDWTAHDWLLPDSYEFQGTPIECVQDVAAKVGAIVRCQDDGSLTVRKKYTVRPINLESAQPVSVYSRDGEIINSSASIQKGTGNDKIQVDGYSEFLGDPQLVVEESGATQTEDVHVKVYWSGKIPDTDIETSVTDGLISFLGELTETNTEQVIFTNSNGSVSKPISEIVSYEWIGANGGTITHDAYQKNLSIDETWGIANVIYKSKYHRYRLSGHNVEILLAALSISDHSNISVIVELGEATSPADGISDNDLTTVAAAVERGKSFLDDNKYDKHAVSLTLPYDETQTDGNVIFLDDTKSETLGNYQIVKSVINFDGPKVTTNAEVQKCLI